MGKHTPRPWEVESDGSTTKGAMDHTLRGPNGKYLASLCETSDDPGLQARNWLPTEEGEANARLIASAPDLLAACRRMVEALSIHHMGGREPFPGDQRYDEALGGLYGAISKATEETEETD